MLRQIIRTLGVGLLLGAGLALAGTGVTIDRSLLRYNQWQEELLAVDTPLHFDQCSHHSPQQELRVGETYLGMPGLEIKTLTYYGTCTHYQIFDFTTGALLETPTDGPDCYAGDRSEREPVILHEGDEGYAAAFTTLTETVARVRRGYACYEERPELANILAYLEYVAACQRRAP